MTDMTQQTHDATAKKHGWDNWDWLSAGSFLSASFLGLLSIANNVRSSFYNNFILGYKETPTVFSDIVKHYTHPETGVFALTTQKREAGLITPTEYRVTNRANAKEFRGKIASKLLADFKIPTDGIEGWTVGTFKRWREMGSTARIDSTVAFATIAATALGAVTVLRHSKDTIDRVEDKLDVNQSAAR